MTPKTLHSVGERKLIQMLTATRGSGAGVLVGPGDDAAVVRPRKGRDLALKCDAIVEGVHFFPATAPQWIGYKAVARVLSDFAAIGATPQHLLISLAAPASTPVQRIRAIYRGIHKIADAHSVSVVGGETVRASQLALHVFGAGDVPRGGVLKRSGAKPGDIIMVTGALGGSLAGRHLRFLPRVEQGRWLAEKKWATAAVDLSDGLSTDLSHLITASGVGADVLASEVPIAAAAEKLRDGKSPIEHALKDGEDFELLFTVPRAKVESFATAWMRRFDLAVSPIGFITREKGVVRLINDDHSVQNITFNAYEHFSH